MTIDERDLTPPGVFMFQDTPLPADLLSRGDGLLRNLDRMAERVRDDAIADFMASPEARAVLAATKAAVDVGLDFAPGRDRAEAAPRPGRWRPRRLHQRRICVEPRSDPAQRLHHGSGRCRY